MYHKTPPLNSPWERSFYTAKQIDDVEEYWNNLNKRRQTMSDIEDKGYIDPTLPKLPTSRESDLLEEMIYDKEITLKHQQLKTGEHYVMLSKRYLNRTDVVKIELNKYITVDAVLEWVSQAIRKLNKREI